MLTVRRQAKQEIFFMAELGQVGKLCFFLGNLGKFHSKSKNRKKSLEPRIKRRVLRISQN